MESANPHSVRSRFELSEGALASLAILIAACLILTNALLHSHVYGNRNYREDEIVVVRMSMLFSPSELAQYSATENHPPGWRLLAKSWMGSFGISEALTRWLSKLINLVTFALIYQLGKHICGKRVGLYAIVLLGVYGFASDAMYELRPYPLLVMLVTALHLLFYRWIHKPSSALMFAYILAGIAAIYTHFFSFFVFPVHAIALVLFTRFERKRWLDSLLLWVFIALSFLGWVVPFVHTVYVVSRGGIYYAIPPGWEGIRLYYSDSKFEPELLYQFLMLLSPFAYLLGCRARRENTRLRFPARFVILYPLILLISTIVIAYAADSVVRSFSQRNVVMFAPTIALCMALGLRLLPTKAALLLILLLILHAPQNIARHTSNGPYREIVQEMSKSYKNDSIVVTEFDWAWRGLLPAAYYLMDFTPDKMSKERLYHLVGPFDNAHPPNYPDELVNVNYWFHAEVFESQLPEHQQLWHLRENDGNELGGKFSEWLDQNYTLEWTVSWADEYLEDYFLSNYSRVPSNDGPMLDVGESLRLYVWDLQGDWDVSPCQAVTIESWWQIRERDATPYTISVILADTDGDGQLAIANSVPADRFTSVWAPNKYYRDRTSVEIPCEIKGGSYDLLLAAKESMTGEPLLLAHPGGDAFGTETFLTSLTVAGEAAANRSE